MPKLAYAQEYNAIFTDELRRIFSDELLDEVSVAERKESINKESKFYLGVDVAGYGEDDCTYEIFEKTLSKELIHIENIVEKRNLTTDTSKKIIKLNEIYNFRAIGIDDGGIGFGVFSELMLDRTTKRKTWALNNSSRAIDAEGKKSKRILKEEMYVNLQVLMENSKIKLLKDDEVRDSLSTVQHDENKIFGSNDHIAEGIIRSVWLAEKDKTLNIMAFC